MQKSPSTMATAVTASTALPSAARARRRRGRPDDALSKGARVSSWQVGRELGRGGMASVHAVTHTRFGRRAAIKIAHRSVLSDQYTPQTFLREARIVHRIDHPAVIDVFGTGSYESRPYIVMERLTGCSLGDRVDAGPVPRGEALEILLELVDVLRATHAGGVVHRDLKLDNIYVCDAPFAGDRRIKLLDWGVAYVDGEDDPFRGLIAGTLTYVAPEQIRGDSLTPAADVYSLAVVAYHLLCRRPPFAAKTDLELIHLHLRAEPPRPNCAWPSIPDELDELLVAMLAKTPEDRPCLDEVERVLTRMLARIAPVRRPVPMTTTEDVFSAPPVDMLGRPAVLPVPPLSWRWIGLAGLVTGLAALISALP
jgi:serine/threonine-protein kinase